MKELKFEQFAGSYLGEGAERIPRLQVNKETQQPVFLLHHNAKSAKTGSRLVIYFNLQTGETSVDTKEGFEQKHEVVSTLGLKEV